MKSLWLAWVSYCIPLCLPGGCKQAAVYIRCDLYLIDFSICQLVRHPFLLSVFHSPFYLSYLILNIFLFPMMSVLTYSSTLYLHFPLPFGVVCLDNAQ